ncbi:hypothetical protein [Salidesulfovibrio onnuriiensis]|uniref:hypothetical protein n=1 Tax=Salidesulfovibrio onnuriiensis TaxID=2583823 RepID=UPI0011C8AFB3|nr:hypothetical protein [Salidesulfovibrio onnuriiensis]
MSEKIHTLETELVEQVLKEQPDFVAVLDDLSQRYGLPARHVLLISNYLQKDLPPGVPAGMDTLQELCQAVKQGGYRIETAGGDLALFRDNGGAAPSAPESSSAGQASGENEQGEQPASGPCSCNCSTGLSKAFVLVALAALAAAGYFLYRYLGQ